LKAGPSTKLQQTSDRDASHGDDEQDREDQLTEHDEERA
jgi:hypothetical protein